MVAEYYDFGTPVDVQAPPQDQTMDGSKLLAGGQTGRAVASFPDFTKGAGCSNLTAAMGDPGKRL